VYGNSGLQLLDGTYTAPQNALYGSAPILAHGTCGRRWCLVLAGPLSAGDAQKAVGLVDTTPLLLDEVLTCSMSCVC
jgi:hypothetical protein